MKLVNWYFSEVTDNKVIAHGKVMGHHKFEDGASIHTSWIEELTFDEENKIFQMRTHSGSQYVLTLADIRLDLLDKTEHALSIFSISANVFMECRKLLEKKQAERLQRAEALLKKQELYLLFEENISPQAYFKDENGAVREIPVVPHTGMFCDTWLVYDEKNEVDFRWFDKFQAMEPYQWSENLKNIQVENRLEHDMEFQKNTFLFQTCKKDEVTVLEREKYYLLQSACI